MSDAGGWLFLVIDVGMVVLLGVALVYGVLQWRRRSTSPAVEGAREEATRQIYESGAEQERREEDRHRPAA
jgi:hypothetical protein